MGMKKNVINTHPKDLSKSPAVAGFFVCGIFGAWLQGALNEIEERRLHNRRIELSLNQEPERVTLSLGIGQGSHSLISNEKV